MLLSHADAAMYRVKRAQGKSGYCFYDPSIDDRSLSKTDLRRALTDGEIVPYYQPLVSFADGRIVAFEALARWLHPVEGCLTPEHFIHLADEAQLHDELFAAIIRSAAADAVTWPSSTGPLRQRVAAPDIQPGLSCLCGRTSDAGRAASFPRHPGGDRSPAHRGLDHRPGRVHGPAPTRTHHRPGRLRHRPFRLETLQHLRFDGLKIDRSFLAPAATGHCPVLYFAAVVELGLKLGLSVTAEGIEAAESGEVARGLGCSLGQGFLYGRPIPGRLVVATLEGKPYP